MHWYTTNQIQFLKDNVKGRSVAELTELFNKQFGTSLSQEQIKGTMCRHKLRNGRDARFPAGHEPFNKGMKGLQQGGEATQFKPGNRPWNHKPVGTERISSDGYAEIKVAEPKKWRGKHVLLWEEANGPVPKGHVVIFADGNRLNVTLDNLICVSRKELAVLNKRKLITKDGDLTRTGVLIAGLHLKIGERKKRGAK